MTTEYLNHDDLVKLLRGATAALRTAETEPGTPPSVLVGARLRHAEALRCCELAGVPSAAVRAALSLPEPQPEQSEVWP